MARPSKIWFVIADGGHARIVTRDPNEVGYSLVTEFDSIDAHHLTHNIVSDRQGRVQESGYSSHHAIEPRTDPHEAEKMRFVRSVASYLNDKGAEGDYDQLVIFAPPRCLHELRESLDASAKRKVKHEAARDLTKIPLAKLSAHLGKLT